MKRSIGSWGVLGIGGRDGGDDGSSDKESRASTRGAISDDGTRSDIAERMDAESGLIVVLSRFPRDLLIRDGQSFTDMTESASRRPIDLKDCINFENPGYLKGETKN